MKLSQLSVSILGILCAVIWLGCDDDDIRPSLLSSTKIAFASEHEGDYDICVMNADGTSAANITNHEADEYTPAWSPDGTKIAFVKREDDAGIYVMNADGTNVEKITRGFRAGLPIGLLMGERLPLCQTVKVIMISAW